MSRRTALTGVLVAAVAAALTACQPSAGTAAWVGDHRITAEQLRADLDSAFATPKLRDGVTQAYGSDLAPFRRQLLSDRVRHELVGEAVRRTGVHVSDDDVFSLIDADGGFDRARDAGHLSHDLAVRRYTDLLLTAELGYTEQHVRRPTETELRAAYQQQAPSRVEVRLGLIQVPDQKTLDQVIAQLTAHPGQFDAMAARFPGSAPEATVFPPGNIPPSIRQHVLAAKPNAILPFVAPGQVGGGQFLVVKVYSVKTPTFESLRVQLALPSLSEAFQAGQAYVADLARQIGVRVNPRYGTWDAAKAQIEEAPNPLVSLVPTPSATASGAPAVP